MQNSRTQGWCFQRLWFPPLLSCARSNQHGLLSLWHTYLKLGMGFRDGFLHTYLACLHSPYISLILNLEWNPLPRLPPSQKKFRLRGCILVEVVIWGTSLCFSTTTTSKKCSIESRCQYSENWLSDYDYSMEKVIFFSLFHVKKNCTTFIGFAFIYIHVYLLISWIKKLIDCYTWIIL